MSVMPTAVFFTFIFQQTEKANIQSLPANASQQTGDAILISRTDNYCSNSTFTSDLKKCLECALTEDIWQYYGDDVASAAKSCSDDATPSPSSASAATAAATVSVSTGTASGATSSVVATTAAAATPTSSGVLSSTGSGSTASTPSSVRVRFFSPFLFSSLDVKSLFAPIDYYYFLEHEKALLI